MTSHICGRNNGHFVGQDRRTVRS